MKNKKKVYPKTERSLEWVILPRVGARTPPWWNDSKFNCPKHQSSYVFCCDVDAYDDFIKENNLKKNQCGIGGLELPRILIRFVKQVSNIRKWFSMENFPPVFVEKSILESYYILSEDYDQSSDIAVVPRPRRGTYRTLLCRTAIHYLNIRGRENAVNGHKKLFLHLVYGRGHFVSFFSGFWSFFQ